MLHQTLPPSSFPPLPYPHSSQVEIEMKMETVEVLPLAVDDVAPVLCEDFSVDDLLNFGGEDEGDDHTAKDNEREKAKYIGEENSNSVVSFEAPPVPELTSLSEIPKMYTLALKSNHSHQQQQPPPQVPVKAKRSKRTRSLSISWSSCSGGGGPLPTSSSSSQSTTTTTTITSTTTSSTTSSPAYYYHSSQPIYAHSSAFEEMTEFKNRQKPKKRGRKPKQVTLDPTNGERRCSHCGVNKTPQWRTGPMGPKTLCNACGVRYKSGRPSPEYWPACSPTFLSHVHSNIRRKVLEMRRKKEGQEKLVFYVNPV